MSTIAVIAFETTCLSLTQGDRATEIAIGLVDGGRVVDRFQSLRDARVRISSFIESFIGVGSAMEAAAPPAAQVMADAGRFALRDALNKAQSCRARRVWWDCRVLCDELTT